MSEQQQQQQEQHHQMMMMDHMASSQGSNSDRGSESRPAPVAVPCEMRSTNNPSSCTVGLGLGCVRKFLWIVMGTLSLIFLLRSEGEANNNMRNNLQQSAAASFTKQQQPQEQQQADDRHDDDDKRPNFILHVGLQKTGTTFLQFTMCSDVAKEILLQDNYVYLGMCARDGPAEQQQRQQHDNDDYSASAATVGRSRLFFSANATYANLPQLIPDFLHSILAAKESGRGLVLSDENISMMSPSNIAALAAVLNPIFRVRVVVVYRRFYEWLPSWHNMFYRVSSSGKTFSGKEITWDFPKNGQGSGLHFDLDNRIGTSDFVYDMELLQQHPAQMVRDKFAEYFPDVTMMNLHNLPAVPGTTAIDPTLHNFICSVMPHATHSCRAVEQGIIRGSSLNNPSISFDYDLLAVAAHEQGFILHDISRKDVGAQIQQYNSILLQQQQQQRAAEDDDNSNNSNSNSNSNVKTLESFPRECLSEPKLDRLLQLSLMGERNLFPPDPTNNTTLNHQQEQEEQQHRREFAAFQSKLCWLDTTAVLQDPIWQSFLQSLGSPSSSLPAKDNGNGARI